MKFLRWGRSNSGEQFPGLTVAEHQNLRNIARTQGMEAAAWLALQQARERVRRGREAQEVVKFTRDPRLAPSLVQNPKVAKMVGRPPEDPKFLLALAEMALDQAEAMERRAQAFVDAAEYYQKLATGENPYCPDDDYDAGSDSARAR